MKWLDMISQRKVLNFRMISSRKKYKNGILYIFFGLFYSLMHILQSCGSIMLFSCIYNKESTQLKLEYPLISQNYLQNINHWPSMCQYQYHSITFNSIINATVKYKWHDSGILTPPWYFVFLVCQVPRI